MKEKKQHEMLTCSKCGGQYQATETRRLKLKLCPSFDQKQWDKLIAAIYQAGDAPDA